MQESWLLVIGVWRCFSPA